MSPEQLYGKLAYIEFPCGGNFLYARVVCFSRVYEGHVSGCYKIPRYETSDVAICAILQNDNLSNGHLSATACKFSPCLGPVVVDRFVSSGDFQMLIVKKLKVLMLFYFSFLSGNGSNSMLYFKTCPSTSIKIKRLHVW